MTLEPVLLYVQEVLSNFRKANLHIKMDRSPWTNSIKPSLNIYLWAGGGCGPEQLPQPPVDLGRGQEELAVRKDRLVSFLPTVATRQELFVRLYRAQ